MKIIVTMTAVVIILCIAGSHVFCNLKIPTFANKNPQLKVGNF